MAKHRSPYVLCARRTTHDSNRMTGDDAVGSQRQAGSRLHCIELIRVLPYTAMFTFLGMCEMQGAEKIGQVLKFRVTCKVPVGCPKKVKLLKS